MDSINKWLTPLNTLLIAALFVAVLVGGNQSAEDLRGTSNYDAIQTSKITVGSSGTGIGTILYGTCYLRHSATYAATTTEMVDCVSSSFAVGDYVIFLGHATSSTELTRQFEMTGTGAASTTAGYAPVRLTNLSGGTVTPAGTGLGSTTPFIIVRPLSTTPGL